MSEPHDVTHWLLWPLLCAFLIGGFLTASPAPLLLYGIALWLGVQHLLLSLEY